MTIIRSKRAGRGSRRVGSVKRTRPNRKRIHRQNAAGADQCWRLTQKYNRYIRTDSPIGGCQQEGDPDILCLMFGDSYHRVGRLGRNRACTACGRYWIS